MEQTNNNYKLFVEHKLQEQLLQELPTTTGTTKHKKQKLNEQELQEHKQKLQELKQQYPKL